MFPRSPISEAVRAEQTRIAEFHIARSALFAWSHYTGHSLPGSLPEPLPDPHAFARYVRSLLTELDRHADRTADVLRQASENDNLRSRVRQYETELIRLRAEMFNLNNSGKCADGQAKAEASAGPGS